MNTLLIGILGSGGMGKTHGQRLAKIPGARVDAVCSRTLDGAVKLNDSVLGGRAACYDNFDRMLADRKLDALYVCLPPDAHTGQVEKAAGRGIHLFLEKPLALTVRRSESMVNAIQKAGVVSQVGYHMRFAHPVRKLKALIDAGKAGTPTLFAGRFWANARHGKWWRDINRCGGQVFEQAIHIYDMAIHLLGRPVAVAGLVDNLCHRDQPDYTVDDTSASVTRFQSGAMASITASNCAIPMKWLGDWRVVCRNLTADFASLHAATFTFSQGKPAEAYWANPGKLKVQEVSKDVDVYLEESKDFIKAIHTGGKTVAPADEGLVGVQLVSAVIKSARTGRMVKL